MSLPMIDNKEFYLNVKDVQENLFSPVNLYYKTHLLTRSPRHTIKKRQLW